MQTSRRFQLSTILLLVLLLVLAACGNTATPTTSEPTDSGEPVTETTPEPEADPETTTDGEAYPAPEADSEAQAYPEPEADPEPVGTEEAMEENLEGAELVVYSGRNEELVGPLIEQFEEESGIEVSVRYGNTAEMAATILEEGSNSPADVYYGQDAGALGALALEGRLQTLPEETLGQVEERFRDPNGQWVGTSGRARVIVYNTEALSEEELPESIHDFTDPAWSGRIGWAPTNASFQAFVTALRVTEGEDAARAWLEGIQANEPRVYDNNDAVLQAVASGEIEVGFVNHYYLFRQLEEQGEDYPARNYFFQNGDIGGLINVAGVGIVDTAPHQEAAEAFVNFLLTEEAQQYFSDETKEYPLVAGVEPDPMLPALSEIETPEINLSDLDDLQGTLDLLQELGIL
ncbi:MAG TPA: extracellular solute-binding protein [Ardenticatenaceae bacterium]|jgi:iron(III) transport system substrate-binding protein